MKTEHEILLEIAKYTGKIERLRRKIAEGRYSHGILRYKEESVRELKERRAILLWVLEL